MVKDSQFIVEMLQKNYNIVVEYIEGQIGNKVSKRTLEESALESWLKWRQRKIRLIAQFWVQ